MVNKQNWLIYLLLIIELLLPSLVQATEKVSIGILAFRPKPIIEAKWQPLIDYLNQTIPNIEFELKPFNYGELEEAIKHKSIDFVFTNSSHYIQLSHNAKLSAPLATLINKKSGHAVKSFAGTILVKNNNKNIQTLKDLKGKTIATPSTKSFGGYQMQAYELLKTDLRVPEQIQIKTTKMPHDNAVTALLNGQVDAAFVRSGVLEGMEEQGKLNPNDLKVLNLQEGSDFPFLHSTRLYPEWPFATMPYVGEALAGKVAGALLALPHNGVVAQAINIQGFRIPADYEPVREVLRTLKVYPYDNIQEITFHDLWSQHRAEIVSLALLITTIISLVLLVFATNRRLHDSHQKLEKSNESLKIAAVAFDTQEAIFITDSKQNIIKVNNAYTRLTGYSPQEAIGQTPRLIKSGKHNTEFYRVLWEHLNTHGYWQGEIWNKRKNGDLFPVGQTITAIKDENDEVTHYVSTFDDITALKENEERIKKLAFYDPLTGLANRRLLNDHLKQALAYSSRNNSYFALLFIDLDHFKNLNDTLGHDVGDLLLIQIGERLIQAVREGDTVSRTGGDEFVILLEDLGFNNNEAAHHAKVAADKILKHLSQPFMNKGSEHPISASIGISLFTDHKESVEEMMIRSDLAMYQAKSDGRNAVRFFDPSMQEAIVIRSQIESELRHAIKFHEFVVFYQPKVDINGKTISYEALLRWQHPQKGLLPPNDFIQIAEESGLIVEIGEWVIQKACKQLSTWCKDEKTKHLTIAVNINEQQISRSDFVDVVFHAIDGAQCPANRLEFEITESLLMKKMDDTVNKINKLKEFGITFAIDDFGTGYSSLNYLKQLPIDWLKIDRSFVQDMLNDANDEAIVRTILALAKTLGLNAVAEGVETEAQRDYLIDLGCPVLQGFLFDKPKPIEEFSTHS
ncbi:EAL domain-containing protein [Thiomicrorhabdus sp. Kp2]|uniref:EAL domain-containing protein n=1 Tax=Thiomicrorhabdus sp. Kp2 TaxID=1123518 RepID=UPI00040FC47A|nr:EAL domain-containing protein [Thiomicrorhabdus sp. Kp2]